MHLQNGTYIADASWRLAIRKYRGLKDALGLDAKTMTADIVHIHGLREKELDVLSIADMGFDKL